MTILATYEERRFDGRRTFELFDDRVVVKGKKSLGAEFEGTVMLETLQPQPSVIRSRPKGFFQGIGLALVSLVFLQSGALEPSSYWGELAIGLIPCGILFALSTMRKVEWAYFSSIAGFVTLTVARAGKQVDQFEPFIKALSERIAAHRHPG